jgi:hypothetical protein
MLEKDDKKTERQILNSMADEQELLEFYKENKKEELMYAQIALKKAWDEYSKGAKKIYNKMTRMLFGEDLENAKDRINGECGEDDDLHQQWCKAIGDVEAEVCRKHAVSVDDNEDELLVTKITESFYITYNGEKDENMFTYEKGFEIELNQNSHFQIDLINKLILDAREE